MAAEFVFALASITENFAPGAVKTSAYLYKVHNQDQGYSLADLMHYNNCKIYSLTINMHSVYVFLINRLKTDQYIKEGQVLIEQWKDNEYNMY